MIIIAPLTAEHYAAAKLLIKQNLSNIWTDSQIDESLSTYSYLAATENGELLGIAVSRLIADECNLDLLCVASEHRRKGIGYALMAKLAMIALEAKARAVFLEVKSTNTAAVRLYSKCGYKTVRRRQSYYKDGADALEMVLTL